MPKFTDNMETKQVGATNFSFSHVDIKTLGATEYTLVGLVADVSGSVCGYGASLEKMVKEVVAACRKSPRADNLQIQVMTFNNTVHEFHGFRPLPQCNEDDYTGLIRAHGMTALYDATYNAIKSLSQYGADLQKQDFSVNAALFVITDGEDNQSTVSRAMVKKAMEDARSSEVLESIMPVLIGVGDGSDVANLNSYLTAFKDEAGFQQYVALGEATQANLAKLGGFISKSISSQSQSLGTGGPSQSLTF